MSNQLIIVLGAQWGDEGKGKLTDIKCSEADYCARYNGSSNAGHTIVFKKEDGEVIKLDFHMCPSGVIHIPCIIGTGVLVNVEKLINEVQLLVDKGLPHQPVYIDERCHMVLPDHIERDSSSSRSKEIGTTKQGVGPCASDKVMRTGIRIVDYIKQHPELNTRLNELDIFVTDVVVMLAQLKNKTILVEGANSAMLDIDLGTYPYVTSTHPTIGGVYTGLGINPRSFKIKENIGVVKAYTTRVGAGGFPTRFDEELENEIRQKGGEYGVTTGRPRDCGWLDLVQLLYSCRVNGCTSLNLTKADVMDGMATVKIATSYVIDGKETKNFPSDISTLLESLAVQYTELPGWEYTVKDGQLHPNLLSYIKFIEDYLEDNGIPPTPIKYVGTGPQRDDMVILC